MEPITFKATVQGEQVDVFILGGSRSGITDKVTGVTIRIRAKKGPVVATGVNLIPNGNGLELEISAHAKLKKGIQELARANEEEAFAKALIQTLARTPKEKFALHK